MVEWVLSLLKLQDLDLEAAKLEAQLAAIPAKEEQTKTFFRAEEEAFAAAKKSVQEIELTIRKLEGEITTLKTQKENFQSKTSLIKNNDEYRAALLQIEQCDKAISEAEEKQIIAMDELEAAKKTQAEKEANLKEAKKNAEAEFSKLEAEKADCKKQLADLTAKRPELAAAVDPTILKRYDRLRTARNNNRTKPCLVPIEDGCCGRCHLSVTSQEANDTLKGKVVLCNSCGALLYSSK